MRQSNGKKKTSQRNKEHSSPDKGELKGCTGGADEMMANE